MNPTYNTLLFQKSIKSAKKGQRPLFLVVIATKPCFIKLASLIWEFEKNGVPFVIVDTGHHYEASLRAAIECFGYEHLNCIQLNIRGDLLGRNADLARKINWLCKIIKDSGFKGLPIPIISGDTSTAGFFSVYWYNKTGIKSIHVEAGLRSRAPCLDWEKLSVRALINQRNCKWVENNNEPFPESSHTRVASIFSQLYFAPVGLNRDNLIREGYSNLLINVVGSLSADAVEMAMKLKIEKSIFEYYPFLKFGKWVRVDLHRRENLNLNSLMHLFEGIEEYIEKGGQVNLILSNALKKAIDHFKLGNRINLLRKNDNFRVTDLWPSYKHVIEFLRSNNCFGLLTDSGGLQEESNILGIPCITYRNSTDRPETILNAPFNLLISPQSRGLISYSLENWMGLKKRKNVNLYGKDVGRRIVNVLCAFDFEQPVISEHIW